MLGCSSETVSQQQQGDCTWGTYLRGKGRHWKCCSGLQRLKYQRSHKSVPLQEESFHVQVAGKDGFCSQRAQQVSLQVPVWRFCLERVGGHLHWNPKVFVSSQFPPSLIGFFFDWTDFRTLHFAWKKFFFLSLTTTTHIWDTLRSAIQTHFCFCANYSLY